MRSYYYVQSKMHYFGIVVLALLMSSCGSYQYAGYEEDAIYGESERRVEYVETEPEQAETDNNGYYKNYFKEKTLQYESIAQEDAVFTDIDSYEGSYEEENDSLRYTEGYGAWGQDHNEAVVINVYQNNWAGWYYPYSWRWGYNWGYNYWGWNSWGWNSWGWGYNNWCPPFYGGGYWGYPYAYGGYWGHPYYYGGYNRPYYGHSYGYAYNAGRRSAYSNSTLASLGRRGGLDAYTGSRRDGLNSSLNQGRLNPRRDDYGSRPTNSRVRPSGNTTGSRVRPDGRVRPGVGSRPTGSRTKPTVGKPRTRPSVGSRPSGSRTKPRVRPNSSTTKPKYNNSRPTNRYKPSTKRRSNNNSSIRRSSSSSRSSGYSRPSSSRRSSGSMSRSSSRSSSSRRGGTR